MSDFEFIKRQLLSGKKKPDKLPFARGLSTGSTLLNLACSGRLDVGYLPGTYTFLVGDSASGKSFLVLTTLAEASLNRHYDNYRFIYDNVEGGALMDIERFFGKDVYRRLEAPGEGGSSTTIEEFFYNLDDALSHNVPCIYVLDSMDCLSTEEEGSKFSEAKQAERNGKSVAGSYGTSKAKANSAGIRRIIPKLKETGSILIIISQTRDNLGFGFEKKTRSGGHALRFYCHSEIWLSIKEKIKKTVKGSPRQVGIQCQAQIKKNRITGKESSVLFPIYYSTGLDDVGSCINFLLDENHWKKEGQTVKAAEFDFKGSYEKLVELVNKQGKEKDLQSLVHRVWVEIDQGCAMNRKNRYASDEG